MSRGLMLRGVAFGHQGDDRRMTSHTSGAADAGDFRLDAGTHHDRRAGGMVSKEQGSIAGRSPSSALSGWPFAPISVQGRTPDSALQSE